MPEPRILIVEDESITAMQIQSSLENAGYQVSLAKTASKALEAVKRTSFDLILMDIHLPGDMDGVEVAKKIPRKLDVPLIYLTGYADEATRNQARETQPRAYLTKPILFQELLSTVEATLNSLEKSNHNLD